MQPLDASISKLRVIAIAVIGARSRLMTLITRAPMGVRMGHSVGCLRLLEWPLHSLPCGESFPFTAGASTGCEVRIGSSLLCGYCSNGESGKAFRQVASSDTDPVPLTPLKLRWLLFCCFPCLKVCMASREQSSQCKQMKRKSAKENGNH